MDNSHFIAARVRILSPQNPLPVLVGGRLRKLQLPVLQLLRSSLSYCGYTQDCSRSARALANFLKRTPALLLSALRLPKATQTNSESAA